MTAATAELVGLLAIPVFLILDLVVRHRRFEAPRFWRLQALAVSAAMFAVSVAATLAWGTLLAGRSLLDLSGLGTWAAAAVGILVYELVHYWYHRAVHRYDVMWKFCGHQMHHSAESLDAWGALYNHPVDTFFFTSWVALVFFPLLGLTPEAGAIGAAFVNVNAMIQHANIRTPRWLGYLVQRPESHSVHHGRHRNNYADLPLWDLVFGTFENPREMEQQVGFYNGASRRIGEMLLGRDVSRPRAPRERAGTTAGVRLEEVA
ncbi:MAG: sterol desaturase family protein [Candidatus Krumholzibacteriia bacterium]